MIKSFKLLADGSFLVISSLLLVACSSNNPPKEPVAPALSASTSTSNQPRELVTLVLPSSASIQCQHSLSRVGDDIIVEIILENTGSEDLLIWGVRMDRQIQVRTGASVLIIKDSQVLTKNQVDSEGYLTPLYYSSQLHFHQTWDIISSGERIILSYPLSRLVRGNTKAERSIRERDGSTIYSRFTYEMLVSGKVVHFSSVAVFENSEGLGP